MREILIHIIPSMVLTFLIQLVFHELGHLIGGIMTRWHLIYLQIFHIVIAKGKRFYKLRRVSTYGIQCIMYPGSLNIGSFLYTLGGCLVNLLLTLLGLVCMLSQHDNPVQWLYFWSFFISGGTLFLINIIPNTKKLCNDGACFKLLYSDKQTRICHNAQLMIARQLYNGLTYRQIGRKQICLSPEYACNDILAYQAVLEYYYWLEMENYELMQNALAKADLNSAISRNVSDIIYMELLYIDLFLKIKDKDTLPIISARYGGSINDYIKSHETKGDVHSLRVKAAYDAYEQLNMKSNEDALCNIENALGSIDNAVNLIKSTKYLYSGEAIFCINQLERVQDLLR